MFDKRTFQAIALVMFLFNLSCAAGPSLPPLSFIEDNSKRIEFQDFSVLPPQGDMWGFVNQTAYQAVLNKQTFARTPRKAEELVTAYAVIKTLTLDEELSDQKALLEWYKEIEEEGAKEARGDVTLFKVSPLDSPDKFCVGARIREEDRNVPSFPGHLFIAETATVACIHPDHPKMVVLLAFSQRIPDGAEISGMMDEGKPFLDSLAFNRLEKPFVTAIIPVGRMPSYITDGFGSIWVTVMDENEVARIDPHTNKVTERIPVEEKPVGIASGHSRIWVSNAHHNSLSVIDPDSNRVVTTIKVENRPYAVLAAEGSIWVVNAGAKSISRIDPLSLETVASIEVGKNPYGITSGGGFIWVSSLGDHSVVKIDPRTNNVVLKDIYAGNLPEGLWYNEGVLWVADSENNEVILIDAETGSIIDGLTMGRAPCNLAAANDLLWVVEYHENAVEAIDIKTKESIGKKIPVGLTPAAIHSFDGDLWISCRQEGTVYRIGL
jgi:YVTN family beta-propeller protein